mgnify:CR=1 FL=1
MKSKYSEQNVIEAVGFLHKNDDGHFVVDVDISKDMVRTYVLSELLERMNETMVQIKSVDGE